jgi:hypothetical protein
MYPSHLHWEPFIALAVKLLAKFGLIPGAAAGMAARKLYQKRRQRRATESWPSAQANVLDGRIHREGPRSLWAEVTYSYFVDEYRSGAYVRKFRKEEEAEELIRQIKDKRIQLRYNPAKPDESVLLEHDVEMQVQLTQFH